MVRKGCAGSSPVRRTNHRERSHGWRDRQTVRVRVLTPVGAPSHMAMAPGLYPGRLGSTPSDGSAD